MKLKDMKNGMILTLRKGYKRIVIGNRLFYEEGTLCDTLDNYNDDLTYMNNCTDNDIMKIEYGSEIIWERKLDWSKVSFGTKVRVWGYDNKNKQVGRFLCYNKNDEGDEFPFLAFIESKKSAYWFKCCEIIEGGDIVG